MGRLFDDRLLEHRQQPGLPVADRAAPVETDPRIVARAASDLDADRVVPVRRGILVAERDLVAAGEVEQAGGQGELGRPAIDDRRGRGRHPRRRSREQDRVVVAIRRVATDGSPAEHRPAGDDEECDDPADDRGERVRVEHRPLLGLVPTGLVPTDPIRSPARPIDGRRAQWCHHLPASRPTIGPVSPEPTGRTRPTKPPGPKTPAAGTPARSTKPPAATNPARPVSAAAARRFLVLRHLLAPPRSLPPDPVERAHGRRSARVAAVRSARDRRPQPRPDAARPDRRLSARVDRRAPVRATGPVRGLQQGPLDPADVRAPVSPDHLGSPRARARGRRVRRARPARRGAARPDPARTAPCPRPTSSRGPPSTGTGARRTRSGPCSRRSPKPASSGSPGATAIGASTT